MLALQKIGIQEQAAETNLLIRCRDGDQDAFAQMTTIYERPIFRYAFYMLGHWEDALDIQQETFVRAYQSIGAFRGDCSLNTWLLKICANLCRTHLRRRQAQGAVSLSHEDEENLEGRETGDPYRLMAQAQDLEILRVALRSLPPAQRELIILREYEELSCEEIGVILGCATVTARVKLFRARKRLQERAEALWQAGETGGKR